MKILIVFVLMAFMACTSNSPRITVTNKTVINFDSIKVCSTLNMPTIFKNIEPNQTLNGRIAFDKNNTSDGAYFIQIYKDGKIVRQKYFGYYTNGKSLNRLIKVAIEADTLKMIFK